MTLHLISLPVGPPEPQECQPVGFLTDQMEVLPHLPFSLPIGWYHYILFKAG